MIEKFLSPDWYVSSVYHIDYDRLYARGIRCLVFDIDNTLLPYYVPHATAEVKELFRHLKEAGFTLFILSNGKRSRVRTISREVSTPALGRIGKPLTIGMWIVRAKTRIPFRRTALIGDQLFMDVGCARSCGAFSILTCPIDAVHDEPHVKDRRTAEKRILKHLHLTAQPQPGQNSVQKGDENDPG